MCGNHSFTNQIDAAFYLNTVANFSTFYPIHIHYRSPPFNVGYIFVALAFQCHRQYVWKIKANLINNLLALYSRR